MVARLETLYGHRAAMRAPVSDLAALQFERDQFFMTAIADLFIRLQHRYIDVPVLRNQQVAGSSPANSSIYSPLPNAMGLFFRYCPYCRNDMCTLNVSLILVLQ